MAKRYGQLKETPTPIIFYFEKHPIVNSSLIAMEKEIKFRFRLRMIREVWGTRKKGDIEFFFISLKSLMDHPIDEKVWERVSCDRYTGRKDKNDKEIYECDKIKDGSLKYPYVYEAYWDEKHQWSLRHFDTKQFKGSLSLNMHIIPADMKLEIIGNIYENNTTKKTE
jgi:hypothetical protein